MKATTSVAHGGRTGSLDRESIEAKALAYLDKFDASTARLRRILSDFVRKRARELEVDPAAYLRMVEDTLTRYQQTGLVDDRRYSMSLARNLLARGSSRQAIRSKLHARGVQKQTIELVLQELTEQEGSELTAARALVRKRRLGHYRPATERRDHFRRDLGVLARAGFDFETARAALSLEGIDEADPF